MRLQDKVVLVTSAQNPCAEAILTGFAREGENCVIVDQDGSKAEQLAAEVRSIGRRATLTDQGEYMLETGDFFLIPLGTSHRNIGDMATLRIILYTRDPLHLADEYIERAERAGQPIPEVRGNK